MALRKTFSVGELTGNYRGTAKEMSRLELGREISRLRRWINDNSEWLGHPAKLTRCVAKGCDDYAAIGWVTCQKHIGLAPSE